MRDIAMTQTANLADVDAKMACILGQGPVADAGRSHLASGGARIRARIALSAAEGLRLPVSTALSCAVASELLHNASLIHDDIQDGDRRRRGADALWVSCGMATALSAGDLMISGANCALADHPFPAEAILLTHDAIATTIRGQAEDLASPETFDIQLRVAARKSGPLLALPLQLSLCAAQADGLDATAEAARDLALAYQALDDLADRDVDLERGTANLCLSLERQGLPRPEAASRLRDAAASAIRDARRHVSRLPAATRAPFSQLADQMDRNLKEYAHAT